MTAPLASEKDNINPYNYAPGFKVILVKTYVATYMSIEIVAKTPQM